VRRQPDAARVGDTLPVHDKEVGGDGEFLAGGEDQGASRKVSRPGT
jgi:hypothetical protein